MAPAKKTDSGDKTPESYFTKVRILRTDKSVIEKGSNVSHYPAEKLEKWLERGMIEAK